LKRKLVIILGPTGIGKTPLVLGLAQIMGAEIVAADSVQVYRYMDIGSAKATREEQALVPHHLIDVVDPDEEYSAGRYREEAQRAVTLVSENGRLVLVSGGTGFYIKALVRGLFAQPQPQEKYREELRSLEAKEGKGYLYRELIKVDPETAEKIHPNDTYRTMRALEVYHLSGTPLSEHHASHEFQDSMYDFLQVGLFLEREQLYRRINERCDRMMAEGFLDEVHSLMDRGYHAGLKSMQSLGYRHLCNYLEAPISLEDTVRIMQRDTRRYAKRQMTWFRSDPSIVWVNKGRSALGEIEKLVTEFLGFTT
jgi:tRNA dimethylallyltransferase